MPVGIDFDQTVSLVTHGLTAIIALQQAVWAIAVQLAKFFGTTVIAAASTPEKQEIAKRLGADYTFDYTLPDWPEKVRKLAGGEGVDVIIETTGGDVVNQALDVNQQ